MYCNAFVDRFGAALEQEQPDGSVRSIAYISRATLDSEKRSTPSDLEAGSMSGPSKDSEATYGERSFAYIRTSNPFRASAILGTITGEFSGGPSSSLRSTTPSSAARAAPTEMLVFYPV